MSEESERIDNLERKVESIDNRLSNIERYLEKSSEQETEKYSQNEEEREQDHNEEDSSFQMPSLEAELGLKWLGRVGILAFVLGVAFSIRFAIQEELIGYTTRILLGIGIGLGTTGLGWIAKDKYQGYERWGATLMGGGAAITYFAVYASYHFAEYREAIGITLEQNLFILSSVALGMLVLAIRDDSRIFTAEALTLGYATAFFGTDIGHYILVYVALISLITGIISAYKEWPGINIYGMVAAFSIYPLWRSTGGYEEGLIYLVGILGIFTASTLAILHKKNRFKQIDRNISVLTVYSLPLAFGTAVTFEIFSEGIQPEYLAYLGVFSVQAVSYLISENLETDLGNHYLYSSVPFGIATVLLYFSDFWSTVVLAVSALVVLAISLQTKHKEIRYASYLISGTTLAKLIGYDSWNLESLNLSEPLASTRPFAFLAVILIFTTVYLLIRINREMLSESEKSNLLIERAFSWALVLIVTTSIYLELTGFRVSALWSIYGFYLLAIGIYLRLDYFRRQSIALLGVTTFKVFILDTAGLDTLSRTLSFLALGTILIAASYLYTNYRKNIEDVVS